MRISARNQIKGKVVDVTKGATASQAGIDICAVDEPGLKPGDSVIAVMKAFDVMIAVD